jgi:hypothetical protein
MCTEKDEREKKVRMKRGSLFFKKIFVSLGLMNFPTAPTDHDEKREAFDINRL